MAEDIKSLEQSERANLRRHGIRFGQFTIFNQLMLKPAPTKLRLLLHSLMSSRSYPAPPQPGLVSIPSIPGAPSDYYSKVGYRLLGSRALRVDMLERLSDLLRTQNIWRGFEASVDMLSITGLTLDQFADLMHSLGYVSERDVRKKAISESETSIASNKKDMESMLEEKTLEKVSSKVELAVSEN